MEEELLLPIANALPPANGKKCNDLCASCVHKNKKGLFKLADIRKKVKANNKKKTSNEVCEECSRVDPKSTQAADWMCVSCGFVGCNDGAGHATKHFKAERSGSEHPLFLSIKDHHSFRCFKCEVDLEQNAEDNGPMKTFIDEYNSFMKISKEKSKSVKANESKESSKEESSENGEKAKTLPRKDKKTDEKVINERSSKKVDNTGFLPVKGLVNLGNTCFFNSIAQCLLHTQPIVIYVDLVGRQESVEILPTTMTIGEKRIQIPHEMFSLNPFYGPLNEHFAYFVRDFRAGRALHPSALFSEIAKKAPRFRGWAQQDAHELLRYLLDGLRTEEMNRYKEAISLHLKIPKNVNPKSLDSDVVALAKGMLKACGRPLIDAVFGGTLLQTVKCSHCGHLSRTFEEFLDLSLPIATTSSKFSFSGATKLHKSASASLSKHQKKKEKASARKRNRRKSHGEDPTAAKAGCSNEQFEPEEDANALDVPNIDDDNEEEDGDAEDDLQDGLNTNFEKMRLSEDVEECLMLLGSELAEENVRSLSACLRAFTATETLSASNAYECEKCCLPFNKKLKNGMRKRGVEAAKRYLIYEPPAVLTLHLKRFEQAHAVSGRVSTRKVPGHISFSPLFDIAPFCTRIAKRVAKGSRQVLYSLYGVVSHSGDLSGGHYVAYVRSRRPSSVTEKFFYEAACLPLREADGTCDNLNGAARDGAGVSQDGEWYYVSDSRVSSISESRVLSAEAYILFYERIL